MILLNIFKSMIYYFSRQSCPKKPVKQDVHFYDKATEATNSLILLPEAAVHSSSVKKLF